MRDRVAFGAAVARARDWIAANALILDTETTGLDDDAEVVEIAVIDCTGAVLLDTLVRPSGPVPAQACAIHGITDAMLAEAPVWTQIHVRFCALVEHRPLVIYNRDFDACVIGQTARRYGLQPPCFLDPGVSSGADPAGLHCAMRTYAEFHGEWSAEKGGFRWQKLSAAAAQQGVTVGNAHRALGDCLMTLGVVRAMASTKNAEIV